MRKNKRVKGQQKNGRASAARGHQEGLATEQLKESYVPPQLMIHGTVETMTQALGGTNTDGLGGSQIL